MTVCFLQNLMASKAKKPKEHAILKAYEKS